MVQTGQWPEDVNGVKFLPESTPDPILAPTPVKPSAPVLPVDRLPDVPGDGTTMGDAVRVDLSDVSRLTVILKALAKSKTIYGVLGMLGLQFLGVNAWDVAIRIGGQIYTVPDLSPYLSTVLASLAVWGRMSRDSGRNVWTSGGSCPRSSCRRGGCSPAKIAPACGKSASGITQLTGACVGLPPASPAAWATRPGNVPRSEPAGRALYALTKFRLETQRDKCRHRQK